MASGVPAGERKDAGQSWPAAGGGSSDVLLKRDRLARCAVYGGCGVGEGGDLARPVP